MKHRTWLLIVTAVVESATGLLLLSLPLVVLELLLGVKEAAPATLFIARLAGAALLTIGIICYLARQDQRSPALFGVLTGILIYNVAAAALLGYAGLGLGFTGIVLWPAVVIHVALAFWCVAAIRL